jgi:hypothetical protein
VTAATACCAICGKLPTSGEVVWVIRGRTFHKGCLREANPTQWPERGMSGFIKTVP